MSFKKIADTSFKGDNKLMPFPIDDEKLLTKYKAI